MRGSVAVMAFVGFCQAEAAVEEWIDEKNPIAVTFSRQSHNRISVENGSINKLFGDKSLFSISIDETIGQAFVSLLHDVLEAPASLTVVTSSGQVQDLLVRSSAKTSEHLILKEEEEPLSLPEMDLHVHTIVFLNEILRGKTPLGYGKREVRVEDQLDLPHPLEATALWVLEGPFEKIGVYEIVNMGRKPIVIEADALKRKGDAWVFLDRHELDFTERSLCLISSGKE